MAAQEVCMQEKNPVITAAQSWGHEMQGTAVFATNYLHDWEKMTFPFLSLLTYIKRREQNWAIRLYDFISRIQISPLAHTIWK